MKADYFEKRAAIRAMGTTLAGSQSPLAGRAAAAFVTIIEDVVFANARVGVVGLLIVSTGVGKTRLMGAFIAYLYLTQRSRHFFVLAPNTTIYHKLISDFSLDSPKYVFRRTSSRGRITRRAAACG
jgi:hypothetical protein